MYFSGSQGHVLSVEVNPCTSIPCTFTFGQVAKLNITFIASRFNASQGLYSFFKAYDKI